MLKSLLAVFCESPCPLCHRANPKTICVYCFEQLSSQQLTSGGRHRWQGDLPLFAWGKYDGQLKRAIALMKYHQQPEIAIVLGHLLGKAWLASNLIQLPRVSVIPIPLHSQKIKHRGYNQAERIARGFCQVTRYSLCSQALIRVRETQAMFELKPEARIKNIQGAFRLGKKLPQDPVLLLDDIYTTGATVNESAQILQHSKIEVIGSIVAATASRT